MVVANVVRDPQFEKLFSRLDAHQKEEIKTRIRKILENPEIGKPMRYARKGTREVYAGSFRISYAYIAEKNEIVFLDIYHKDKQ